MPPLRARHPVEDATPPGIGLPRADDPQYVKDLWDKVKAGDAETHKWWADTMGTEERLAQKEANCSGLPASWSTCLTATE